MAYRDQLQEEIERLARALVQLIGKLNSNTKISFEELFEKETSLKFPDLESLTSNQIDQFLAERGVDAQNAETCIEALLMAASLNSENNEKYARACLQLIEAINGKEDAVSLKRLQLKQQAIALLNTI